MDAQFRLQILLEFRPFGKRNEPVVTTCVESGKVGSSILLSSADVVVFSVRLRWLENGPSCRSIRSVFQSHSSFSHR